MRLSLTIVVSSLLVGSALGAPVPASPARIRIGSILKAPPSKIQGLPILKNPKTGLPKKGASIDHPVVNLGPAPNGDLNVAPISHTPVPPSTDISKLTPSIPNLSGQVHTNPVTVNPADTKPATGALAGAKATGCEVLGICNEISGASAAAAARPPPPASSPATRKRKRSGKAVASAFKLGSVIKVPPIKTQGLPILKNPKTGTPKKGASIDHPAIVTGHAPNGDLKIAPISHTPVAPSTDVSKLTPSIPNLSGHINTGSVTANPADVKPATGALAGAKATGCEVLGICNKQSGATK